MTSDPAVISARDLADAADEPLLDARGRVVRPLLAVDLDGGADAGALGRAAAAGRLLVGLARAGTPPVRPALDLLVTGPDAPPGPDRINVPDPDEHVRRLHAAAAGNPQAAVALGQVLRMTGALPVAAALDAESFAYSTLLAGPEFRAWLEARGRRPPPPPAGDPVLVRRAGDELQITLNRPARRNAYGRQLRDALVEALRLPLLDPTIARVALDGAGPSFCSGGDLDEFGTAPDLATAHFIRTRAGAGGLVHALRDRVAVRVHGACVGAGIEVPAFAGSVVAAPGATFRLPEVGMGLIPGAGGTVSIPRRIGRGRTLDLALTGRELPAETALGWGLIDAIRP